MNEKRWIKYNHGVRWLEFSVDVAGTLDILDDGDVLSVTEVSWDAESLFLFIADTVAIGRFGLAPNDSELSVGWKYQK